MTVTTSVKNSIPQNPLSSLSASFRKVRWSGGRDLSRVIRGVALRIERGPAQEFEPIIFPLTKRA